MRKREKKFAHYHIREKNRIHQMHFCLEFFTRHNPRGVRGLLAQATIDALVHVKVEARCHAGAVVVLHTVDGDGLKSMGIQYEKIVVI